MSRALAYRTTFQGLGISIENAVGSIRAGVGPDGMPWEIIMTCPYGYIRNTEGTDGDHVDCFLGPNEMATHAYVIHAMQAGDPSRYDEDKVMLGFDSEEHAKQTFLDNYTKPEFFGGMHIIAMPEFIEKVLATKERPAMIKASSVEDTKDYLAESEQIKKNRTDPANQLAHQFVAARWTWPNGHSRCLLCGQEEPTSGLCQPSQAMLKSTGSDLPFLVLFGKAHVKGHSRVMSTGKVAFVKEHNRHRESMEYQSLHFVTSNIDVSSHSKKIGAITVRAWRSGSINSDHLYFASDYDGAFHYSALHDNAKPMEYIVQAKNVLVGKSHFQLYEEFFNGKTMQTAIWEVDKKSGFKSSVNAWRIVQARLMDRIARAGYDAVILTEPPAPATHELIVIKKNSTQIQSVS